jgi:hypothetical protein
MSVEECERLSRAIWMSADNWAWVIAPTAGFAFFGLGIGSGIEWALAKVGWSVAPYLHWSLVAIAIPPGVRVSYLLLRSFRVSAAEAERDISKGLVEVIQVRDPVYVEQAEYEDEGPILFFDIGNNKILFLSGQWLYDQSPPFPSTQFTIHRSAVLGRVFKIDASGERLQPQRTLPCSSVPVSNLRESELLDGSLNDLPAAVAYATSPRAL